MSARDHVTTCAALVRNGECSCPAAALQLKAKSDRIYLWCPTCDRTARSWGTGAAVTVPQLILAEHQHREAAHPRQLDLSGLHDAVGEEGE